MLKWKKKQQRHIKLYKAFILFDMNVFRLKLYRFVQKEENEKVDV